MPAPAQWSVSRPVRVVRRGGEYVRVIPGERLHDLHHDGGQCWAVRCGEWVIVPIGAWSALVLVPPDKKRSA
jgi:hypothetical protein